MFAQRAFVDGDADPFDQELYDHAKSLFVERLEQRWQCPVKVALCTESAGPGVSGGAGVGGEAGGGKDRGHGKGHAHKKFSLGKHKDPSAMTIGQQDDWRHWQC